MSENDKNVLLIVCDFHTTSGKRGTLKFFQKRRFQGFIYEILRVVGLLGEKFICFQLSWGQLKFPGVSNVLCILMLSF